MPEMTTPTLDDVYCGDALEILRTWPDAFVDCCVTSPPYYGLRDYGCDQQIGLEPTPDAYVARMVAVFAEVRRVLKPTGTLWLNIGDSYAGGNNQRNGEGETRNLSTAKFHGGSAHLEQRRTTGNTPDCKPKDMLMIPAQVALALRADGWYLRSDIIWCLSGGTWLYVKSQKGAMPMMVKDLARLNPATVQLWNGDRWTQLLGMSKSARRGDEIELTLRSGERISCTPTHRFPTARGLVDAGDLQIGDALVSACLPDNDHPLGCAIDEDAAWLAGLYLAEGSHAGDTIQISGHSKETARWERLQQIAHKYGGSATITVKGNQQAIRLYGKVLSAIISELVSGRDAHDKCFAPVVWQYSNRFIAAMVDGYLAGDGHWEQKNNRWRLGFCRNYNLERDLRTACARLGWHLVLKMSTVQYKGEPRATFRGELRKVRLGYRTQRNPNEITSITKARCRYVYDIGVADDPHLFALASGILTHNSKPNPMPESVTDRPTKSHEHIFLLSKSAKYYYDAAAIAEPAVVGCFDTDFIPKSAKDAHDTTEMKSSATGASSNGRTGKRIDTRNARDVWTIATHPYSGAHFATFPPELPRRCILAGCPPGGICLDPFFGSGTVGFVAARELRHWLGIELNPDYIALAQKRTAQKVLFAPSDT
jgi:DNA modification methylase